MAEPASAPEVAGEEYGATAAEEYDIWRDSAARYLGYANELGESFRPIAARFVGPSYGVSFAYVLADTYDKRSRALQDARVAEHKRQVMANVATVDTLIWQSLASVIVPGYTIKMAVAFVSKHIESPSGWFHSHYKLRGSPPWMRLWVPTATGLALIPFIVKPIDTGVEHLMDFALRPLFAKLA